MCVDMTANSEYADIWSPPIKARHPDPIAT